jgi:drug/metabolite transporter (DMT)-like permease
MSIAEGASRARFDWAASLALTLAALFWSGNFIAGRALRDDIDPVVLNTLRWVLASAFLLPFAAGACLRHRASIRRHWLWLLSLGATGIAAFHTTVYTALTETTATNALLVLALAPVTILIGSAAIGAGRLGWLQAIGSAVSFAGAAILITRGDAAVLGSLSFNAGDLWMLVAVVIWAVYSLLLTRGPPDLPPIVTLAASMVFGTALMLPVLALTASGSDFALSPRVFLPLGYIVVFPSALAFFLWGFGVSRMGAGRAGQFVHLMPVFGPVLAMAILGEQIVAAQAAGALLVFAGIAMVVLGGRK